MHFPQICLLPFWSGPPPRIQPRPPLPQTVLKVTKPTVSRESFWNHSIKKWSGITSRFILNNNIICFIASSWYESSGGICFTMMMVMILWWSVRHTLYVCLGQSWCEISSGRETISVCRPHRLLTPDGITRPLYVSNGPITIHLYFYIFVFVRFKQLYFFTSVFIRIKRSHYNTAVFLYISINVYQTLPS